MLFSTISSLVSFLFLVSIVSTEPIGPPQPGPTCIVPSNSTGDSAPAITSALSICGHNSPDRRGKIIFTNSTYLIRSVMDTTSLSNVDIEHHGLLLWDASNISYWLTHSLPVGYQNQTSAWRFGGHSITWSGHTTGTFNGSGNTWYSFIHGVSNYPGRPHQITITNTTDSTFSGLRFLQSQMWTMTVIHSSNVLLQDIYVNNTSNYGSVTSNTDGANTMYADNITFRNWTVHNGDDSLAVKANSTNILIEDMDFHGGLGVAIGSIGQYNNTYETIQNVTARRVATHGMRYGGYLKTWTGISRGYPPNGGGGGLGFASNITFEDFDLVGNSGVFAITQCTNYEGSTGDCDTSEFNLRDVRLRNWTGTVSTDTVASLQCSAASPCTGIEISGMGLRDTKNATASWKYLCGNVLGTVGFNCTGLVTGENNLKA